MSTFGERVKPHLEAIYRAALVAADPEAAVLRTLRRDGDALQVGARSYDLKALRGVQLLAVGKAAAAMARGAGRAWGEAIVGGLAVTSRGNAKGDAPVPVLVASHPVPDEASVAGARGLLDHAR